MRLENLDDFFVPDEISLSQENNIVKSLSEYLSKSSKDKNNVAFFSITNQAATSIRATLSSYTFEFKNINLFDFGILLSNDEKQINTIIACLNKNKTAVVILGSFFFNPSISNCFIAPHFKRLQPFLESQKSSNNPNLIHSVIGYQAYLSTRDSLVSLEEFGIDHKRLGLAKSKMESLEPIIRGSKRLAFDLDALRYSDFPSSHSQNPSGFFTFEACKIARYAGLSESMNTLLLTGFSPRKGDKVSLHTIAQIIWYFIEGVNNRLNDYPNSTVNLKEFVVQIQESTSAIIFWKSSLSGRWWLQTSSSTSNIPQLVPCSYQEYLDTCEGNLPDLLFKYGHLVK